MFSGYNKNELDQIRLGNWQEELALKETTGFNRGPKPGDSQFRGSYAQRVIEHTERTEPADYKSTAHGTHIHPSEFKTFIPLAKHGKREAMLQQTFREAIDEATDGGALDALVAANDVKVEEAKARLRAEVDKGDLEAASNVVVELNFFGKIEGEALAKADGEGWSVAFGDRRRQA